MAGGTIDVGFEGRSGQALAGKLHLPAGRVRACALFAHCFTCSKDLNAVVRIGRALAQEGIATLRFDFTGLGRSGGDFADTSLSGNVEDVLSAADWLREHHGAPALLVGHSLGGAAVLLAAGQVPDAVAVATIGAPCDPAHVRHLLRDDEAALRAHGEAVVDIGGRPFRLRRELLDDLERHDPAAAIRAMGKALLILHSPQDTVVGVDNARRIYESARHPKSFVTLDGADHLLTRAADAEYVARVLAAWVTRYLPAPAEGEAGGPLPEGVVEVCGGASGLVTAIQAGHHRLGADEPERAPGGTDTAPNPYELLLSSLGACTVMTLRLYADRKGWPLEATRVRLSHRRVHAADCADCESATGRVDEIAVDLTLEGDLDAAQRARLVEIAHRCPVHRTLTTETRIRVRPAEG